MATTEPVTLTEDDLIRMGHERPGIIRDSVLIDRPFPDEEPTRPRGVESEVGILASYYRQMAREDRAYLLRLAEGYAARNTNT